MKKLVFVIVVLALLLTGCGRQTQVANTVPEENTKTATALLLDVNATGNAAYHIYCPDCKKEFIINIGETKVTKTKCANCGTVYNIAYK